MDNKIPTATETRVFGNSTRQTVVIHFRTPGLPLAVEVPFQTLAVLLSQMAQCLSVCSEVDVVREVATSFAIREVQCQVRDHLTTMCYDLECGLHLEATIDLEDARRLHQQLGEALSRQAEYPIQ